MLLEQCFSAFLLPLPSVFLPTISFFISTLPVGWFYYKNRTFFPCGEANAHKFFHGTCHKGKDSPCYHSKYIYVIHQKQLNCLVSGREGLSRYFQVHDLWPKELKMELTHTHTRKKRNEKKRKRKVQMVGGYTAKLTAVTCVRLLRGPNAQDSFLKGSRKEAGTKCRSRSGSVF